MTEYNFRVTSREVKSYVFGVEESINIEISKSRFSSCSLFVSLSLDKSKEQIAIKDIDIKKGTPIEEKELIGYITGYFEFLSSGDINTAMNDLKLVLNNEQTSFRVLENKWNTFARQFTSWFNEKLRPCLDKELELHKMYFEER
ncbi:hypothetical protein Trichorick_01391 (plasmid) [Candidatus Trichorickettsia mobilis]|uniref:Uncharacterized protein n=1 Tax=Candidatus Trichorickettsia mobilis TaxID=1346319 RepID=A0ABZ0UWR9_9RICK|nr:hypothetical protein [Candidatus Trichorickettsia mobilis]WPY01478.1 hypothetical protein Trichorick_01391 [Candidatus Trichorickettsia mobilis]